MKKILVLTAFLLSCSLQTPGELNENSVNISLTVQVNNDKLSEYEKSPLKLYLLTANGEIKSCRTINFVENQNLVYDRDFINEGSYFAIVSQDKLFVGSSDSILTLKEKETNYSVKIVLVENIITFDDEENIILPEKTIFKVRNSSIETISSTGTFLNLKDIVIDDNCIFEQRLEINERISLLIREFAGYEI